MAQDTENVEGSYHSCRLCPRACGVDRSRKPGFCGESDRLRVAWVGPHFGEEPPISGDRGSGTVFLCGCGLRCAYCQNHQISQGGVGEVYTSERLGRAVLQMIRQLGVHNLNFVTPDPFAPHLFRLIEHLKSAIEVPPVVFNVSGYQSRALVETAEPFVDIYLPDYKYADASLARTLSRAPDYPGRALDAISRMVEQKGFLKVVRGLAQRGVLVRHLVLPGHIRNSLSVLTSLYLEFGPGLPLSLMSQYHPLPGAGPQVPSRFLSDTEFREVLDHAEALGFETLFVQFPGDRCGENAPFFPDFNLSRPFGEKDPQPRP